jgi:CDP-glucose 4,6-dehydratase
VSDPKRVDPAFWSGRKVLVTGHTGFKGAWLALWLRALGASVTGFSDGVPTAPSLFELADVGRDVRDLRGDVRDGAAVVAAVREAAPEVVLHLAAQPLVRRSFAAPAETYAVNVLGTANVLDAARAVGGVRAVVVVTSDKCYAPGPHAHGEDDPLGGDDPYSSSKAGAELVAAAYRASFGLPVATGRAGNVVGGGDWGADRLLPDVVAAALEGRPVELRNPGAVRPWQHVLNPLAGYLLLAEALAGDPAGFGGGWNFGPASDDALPVRALVERIGALWGAPLTVVAQPGEHPPEAQTLRLDSAKARELLGWRPAWDLDDGLRAIVEWTQALRDGGDLRAVTLGQIERYGAVAAAG